MKNNRKLYFYDVDLDYINYLKNFEDKIPNISYSQNNKFLCGVIFQINENKYYVPVSSFKKQQKTNFLIRKNDGTAISSLRFSFMFPVPDSLVKIKDFSKENPKYRALLDTEWRFCNKHFNEIEKLALKIYNDVCTNPYSYFKDKCCDYKLLELKCREYTEQS